MQRTGKHNHRQTGKKFCAMLAVLALAGCMVSPLCQAADGVPKAVLNAKNGVVRIVGSSPDEMWTGTGFGIGTAGKETQYFLTNWHVITGDTPDAGDVYIALSDNPDGWIPCDIVYMTGGYPDFAIIRAEQVPHGRVALPLFNAQGLSDGTAVYAIGYPATADTFAETAFSPEASTLTAGIVSRSVEATAAEDTWVIQHTAHINGGNSGGPLVNSKGAVVGINTYGAGDYNEYNLAIFIEYAIPKLNELGIPYGVYTDWSVLLPPALTAGLAVAAVLLFAFYSRRRSATRPPSPGELRLQCLSGVFAPRRFAIRNPTRIGRDPSRNDLIYPDSSVKISGSHCQLVFEGGKLYLEDLNSTNGTYRNGTKIPVMQRVPLDVGNVFSLADSSESFRIETVKK